MKCMDFRKSFFLSCEQFFHIATSKGICVNVIRAMGVYEEKSNEKNKCDAVVRMSRPGLMWLLMLLDRLLVSTI